MPFAGAGAFLRCSDQSEYPSQIRASRQSALCAKDRISAHAVHRRGRIKPERIIRVAVQPSECCFAVKVDGNLLVLDAPPGVARFSRLNFL